MAINELARWTDRLGDAARAKRGGAPSTGTAIVRVNRPRDLAAPAAKGGEVRKQVEDDEAEDSKVLSLRLEIVDSRERRVAKDEPEQKPDTQPVVQPARPRAAALPWPTEPPAAAVRQGTPEAYRAVAAYGEQLQLVNRVRHQDQAAATQLVRISA